MPDCVELREMTYSWMGCLPRTVQALKQSKELFGGGPISHDILGLRDFMAGYLGLDRSRFHPICRDRFDRLSQNLVPLHPNATFPGLGILRACARKKGWMS